MTLLKALQCDICSHLPWSRLVKPRCIHHGFNLDLGCGGNKQKGFVGADKRGWPGVDLVMDIETLPWPIPSNSVDKLLMSHVLEHLKPWLIVDIINEMWRVMKSDSQALIAVPYAGSFGFWQDPTHVKGFNEASWAYFAPHHPSLLYTIYRPNPWKIARCHANPLHSMEVVLEPIKECVHQQTYQKDNFLPDGNAFCSCCLNHIKIKSGEKGICYWCTEPKQKSKGKK